MTAPLACQLCDVPLQEETLVTVWAGRHGPTTVHPPTRSTTALRQEYVARLCESCAEALWPHLRDRIRIRLVPRRGGVPDDEGTNITPEKGVP